MKKHELSMIEFSDIRCADIVDYLEGVFGEYPLENRRTFDIVRQILHLAGVPRMDYESCIFWAFGPKDVREAFPHNFIERWQTQHPRAPKIDKNDKFMEALFVVAVMYLSKTHKSKV